MLGKRCCANLRLGYSSSTDARRSLPPPVKSHFHQSADEAYNSGLYGRAYGLYSEAMSMVGQQDTETMARLFANRAATLMNLERNADALRDCEQVHFAPAVPPSGSSSVSWLQRSGERWVIRFEADLMVLLNVCLLSTLCLRISRASFAAGSAVEPRLPKRAAAQGPAPHALTPVESRHRGMNQRGELGEQALIRREKGLST